MSLFTGEDLEKLSVGQTNSPLGTINISVYHRTKLTISPQQGPQISIMLKSDHFKKDLSPKHKKSEEKWVIYLFFFLIENKLAK